MYLLCLDNNFEEKEEAKERSTYARGRSLPLELLDQLPRLPSLLPHEQQQKVSRDLFARGRSLPLELLD